jgi:hypothetical protein
MINWNLIIDDLENKEGIEINIDPSKWNTNNPEYEKILKLWKDANFNLKSIKWINYYPTLHYDESIVTDVAKMLDINVHRSWISRIDPGYIVPWHWDIDDNEEEYLKHGSILRYTVIPKTFVNGHIFILDDVYYYNLKQDFVIKWNNSRDWHSGINAGLEANWMFHILGSVRSDL